MSTNAPWIALAIDWHESAMFDEASHGERLAWVCLLCHAKGRGRGGKVTLRKTAFAATYNLSIRAVEGMLEKAQKCAAIETHGETVTLMNWGSYQWKASRSGHDSPSDSPERRKTQAHTVSVSVNGSLSESSPDSEGGCKGETRTKPEYTPEFEAAWDAYGRKGAKRAASREFIEAVKRVRARAQPPPDVAGWLSERAGLYRAIHDQHNLPKFRKDFERWLKDGLYDFDEAALRASSETAEQRKKRENEAKWAQLDEVTHAVEH